jgi:hypothetical protein
MVDDDTREVQCVSYTYLRRELAFYDKEIERDNDFLRAKFPDWYVCATYLWP